MKFLRAALAFPFTIVGCALLAVGVYGQHGIERGVRMLHAAAEGMARERLR